MQNRMEQGEGIRVEQTALLSPGRALCNTKATENLAGMCRGAVCSAQFPGHGSCGRRGGPLL